MKKKHLFALLLVVLLWFSIVPSSLAENKNLIPCSQSPEFIARMKEAPNGYYYDKPFKAYSNLLCGEDGLPHLPLDRLSLAVDIGIAFGMFFYITGWIGWTGRSYLLALRKQGAGEEKEIFIDVPLFVGCMLASLTWPLLAIKEFMSGELVAKDDEIPISVR
jgi:photosystem I subunit 3